MFPLFAANINGTSGIGGKFATGVIDTGGKFANNVTVHLDLLKSLRLFEQIWNNPDAIIRGLLEDDSQKNQKQKISWHCPFETFIYILKHGGFQT